MSVGAIRAGRAMIEIFADSTMLARGLAGAQGKLARFANTLRRLGTTQIVIGASLAAPLAAATVAYAQLEKRINTVRALSGATSRQMAGLAMQIRQIGMATGTAFTEIADAMGELVRAGVKVGDLGRATRVVADFSRAAGIDMARAANIGVEIMTQFGLSMEHLPRVADVLQEMANATVSTVEDLSDGFRYAGQSANTFGLSLEETAAAIAYLQQSGLSASTAGTSFNQMLLQIVQNLDKLEIAVGNLRGADGEFLPFVDILGKLKAFLKGMPGPERLQFLNQMFDVRGMRGADALLRNIEAWMQLTAQAQASTGATARKAAEMAQAFIVSFEKMRNGVVMLGFAIGEALDSDLRKAFDAIGNLSVSFGDFVKKNAEIVRTVLKTSAALIASGVAFFSLGLSIQLAMFSLEGFLKIGGGVAAALLSPFRLVATLAGTMASSISFLADKMFGLGRIGMRLVGLAFTPLRLAIGALIATLPALTAALSAAAQASVLIVTLSAYTVRAMFGVLASMAAVPGAAVSMAAAFRVMGAMIVEAMTAGIAVVAQFGFALVGAIPALAGIAGGVAVVAVGFVALAVAAKAAQAIGQALGSMLDALGQGLPKIWENFVGRAKSVWPEILRTASAGWSGITAALQSGDISLAWRIFVDSARAAFAQVMMIIGPNVDDAAEMLFDIGHGLLAGLRWAVDQAVDVFSELKNIAGAAFNWLAAAGEALGPSIVGSLGELGDVFGRMGSHAEEAGDRIYNALAAGDIVAAWAAAINAIGKMFIELASWWDLHVAQPVRLFGQEMGNGQARQAVRDRARPQGRQVRMAVGDVLGRPRTEEELDQMEQDAVARLDGNEEGQATVREAGRVRREELRAAGVQSPEAQARDRERRIAEQEDRFQQQEAEREERRAKNRDARRREADARAAAAESGASVAQEARRNRELGAGIDSSWKPEEFDRQQEEIDARSRERDAAEQEQWQPGDGPEAVNGRRRATETLREKALSHFEERRGSLADAVGRGDITPEQADVYSAQIDQAEAAANAATTAGEVERSLADLNEAAADAADGFGIDENELSIPSSAGGRATAEEARASAKIQRERAEKADADLAAAQASDNAKREEEAAKLREEAAAVRRAGDEAGAAEKEKTATALEQALDPQEAADMQRRLDEQRANVARQEELREQGRRGGAAGEMAAEERRLDSVGGFMNDSFDQLGFGSNLAERQAKAAEDTAKGVNRLVGIAENNGGVFV